MNGSRKILFFAVSATAILTLGTVYMSKNTFRKEITMSDEKEVKASLDAGLASLRIARGKPALVFGADAETSNDDDITNDVEYSVRDRVGYLSLNTEDKEGHHGHSIHISNLESTHWNTYFTDAVPISFDVQLGLGKGDFD